MAACRIVRQSGRVVRRIRPLADPPADPRATAGERGERARHADPLHRFAEIHQIPVRELGRSTKASLAGLADGARTIVTAHAEPLAVMLTPRDAIEILLIAGGELDGVCAAGWRDFDDGNVYEPWPALRRRRLLFARAATRRYGRLGSRDRGQLRRLLGNLTLPPDGDAGIAWIESGMALAVVSGCGRDDVLVHAIPDGRKLERRLTGPELASRRVEIAIGRYRHAGVANVRSRPMAGPAARRLAPAPGPEAKRDRREH